jgi:hypothetical protein
MYIGNYERFIWKTPITCGSDEGLSDTIKSWSSYPLKFIQSHSYPIKVLATQKSVAICIIGDGVIFLGGSEDDISYLNITTNNN